MIGFAYKIICEVDETIVYVGSTKQKLIQRFSDHKSYFRRKKRNLWCSIHFYFEEKGVENFKIIELERVEVEDLQELKKYEQQWIDELDCVNKQAAYLTEEQRKERKKICNRKYYENVVKGFEERKEACKNDPEKGKATSLRYRQTDKYRETLQKRLQKYIDEKRFYCEECDKAFISKQNLNSHNESNH